MENSKAGGRVDGKELEHPRILVSAAGRGGSGPNSPQTPRRLYLRILRGNRKSLHNSDEERFEKETVS